MKKSLKSAFSFLWVCLVMGTTCFGGGYGMIPVMEREFVVKRKYLSQNDLTEIIALAQTLPGLISLNTLIMLSYRKAGFMGVICSIIGLTLPSLLIIVGVVLIYDLIKGNKWVDAALLGVKGGVIGVLVYAIYRMWESSIKNKMHIIIMVVALIMALIVPINPIYIILSVGITFVFILYFAEIITRKKLAYGENNDKEEITDGEVGTDTVGDEVVSGAHVQNGGEESVNEILEIDSESEQTKRQGGDE